MGAPATRSRILVSARDIVQRSGFGQLHYADVSERVGVRGATIHHYFPHKADLGVAVLAEYRVELAARLAEIEGRAATSEEKLLAYVGLYRAILVEDEAHMCPGGMLAAEVVVLPPELRGEVRGFFDDNEQWLAAVLSELLGERRLGMGELRARARRLLALLQGALLLARLYGEPGRFDEVAASWPSLVGVAPLDD